MDEKINEILENMIEYMGKGGMDISYNGRNYEKAKLTAVEMIKELFSDKNNI